METDTQVKTGPEQQEIKTGEGQDVSDKNGHSDVDQRIIRQIEYYFGDYNLLRDKFLKEQISQDNGWISMETMIKFKRLAELSTDFDVIINALKKSTSGLMEIDEENKKIRRSADKPLPEDTEEYREKVKGQTVYCKGFPREDTTIDKILEFFSKFDGVEDVRLRYINNKSSGKPSSFKGSLTVLFKSRELAEQFLNLPDVKYGENELLRQWLTEWEEEKKEQMGSRNRNKREGKEKEEKEPEAEPEVRKLPRGTVLKITKTPAEATRDSVKEAFGQFPVEIAYVEQSTNDSCFYIRFRGENDAKVVLEKSGESKVKVNDAEVTLSVLEGEEEEKYLTNVEENIHNRVKQLKDWKRGGGGRGRGRGGRGGRGRGGRGFKRSGSPGGRAAKRQKADN